MLVFLFLFKIHFYSFSFRIRYISKFVYLRKLHVIAAICSFVVYVDIFCHVSRPSAKFPLALYMT